MIAAEQGNLEIVKELIKNGANCNLEDLVDTEIIYSRVFFVFLCCLFLRRDAKVIDDGLSFVVPQLCQIIAKSVFFNPREIFAFNERSQLFMFFMCKWHGLNEGPEWVCEGRKLEVLDIGHNQICELPAR